MNTGRIDLMPNNKNFKGGGKKNEKKIKIGD